MKIVLYESPLSPYVQKVKVVLFEKGVSFETKSFDLLAGEHQTDEFSAMNPFRRVPVLGVGASLLFESTAINEYLNEQYPKPPLLPTDSILRAEARAWEEAGDAYLGPILSGLVRENFRKAEGPDAEVAAGLHAEAAKFMDALAGKLDGRDFVAGLYSLADIGLAIQVAVLGMLGVGLGDWANLRSWLERVTDRDSFRQAQPPREVLEGFLKGARGATS